MNWLNLRAIEHIGRLGGAALIIAAFSFVLAMAGLHSGGLIAAVAVLQAGIVIPATCAVFLKERLRRTRTGALPDLIDDYLKHFPAFAVPSDLSSGFVKTSLESFTWLFSAILDGLAKGDEIRTTDRLILGDFSVDYWHSVGLTYLECNFNAVRKGVSIHRNFIVSRAEQATHSELLNCIVAINEMCGVQTYIVAYEDLPPACRAEFALFGNMFADVVTYDIYGRDILENRLYFSEEKYAEVQELLKTIGNLAHKSDIKQERARSFANVKRFAENVRKKFTELPPPRPVSTPLIGPN